MALIEKIQGIVPRWMVTAPRDAFVRLMSGPAAMLDALAEATYQARYAFLPGQMRLDSVPGLGGFDSIDALFRIARDRMVIPAQVFGQPWVIEKPWDLALRLRNWRDDWLNNVGAFGLLDQIAFTMVPTVPVLRLVQRGGGVTSWFTRETNGTRRLQRSDGNGFTIVPDGTVASDPLVAQAWDWDSQSRPVPHDQNDDSRCWIIAYPPAATPYLTATDATFDDPGAVGDAWDNPNVDVTGQATMGTVGTNAPAGYVALVQAVVMQRHSAGCKNVWLIWAFDAASFAPDGSSTAGSSLTAYPAGQWAWHTTYDDGGNQRVVARLQTAEYWLLADTVGVPEVV